MKRPRRANEKPPILKDGNAIKADYGKNAGKAKKKIDGRILIIEEKYTNADDSDDFLLNVPSSEIVPLCTCT